MKSKLDIKENITLKYKNYKMLSTLMASNNFKDRFKNGDMAFLEEEDKIIIFKDNEWIDLPEKVKFDNTKGFSINLYDLNKNLMDNMLPMENIQDTINEINEKMISDNLMLMCREISYYTILQKNKNSNEFKSRGEAALTCARDIGKIILVDYVESTNAFEIWVRTPEDENLCLYLFDCSGFIVEYKE